MRKRGEDLVRSNGGLLVQADAHKSIMRQFELHKVLLLFL
jgi:hypothetical protein